MTITIPSPKLVRTADLRTDGRNPNRMSAAQKEALKENLRRFGFIVPVIANKDLVVADGEHRLEAARELGMEEVPVIALDVDEVDRRILRQVLNKLRGEHLPEKDLEEYKFLMEQNALQALSELSAQEPSKMLKMMDLGDTYAEAGFDIDQAFDSKPIAQEGDVWKLGDHTLIVGDSTRDETFAKFQEQEYAITLTDPPYNVAYDSQQRHHPNESIRKGTILNDDLSDEMYRELIKESSRQIVKRTKGSIYICIGSSSLPVLMREMRDSGAHWSTTIIWAKNHFTLSRRDYHPQYECLWYGWKEGNKHSFYGGRTQGDFWEEEPRGRAKRKSQGDIWRHNKPNASPNHPTTKPLELCRHAILDSTTKGEAVLDPFLGSGSTLIACEQTGRRCYGIELDPQYASVVIKRWEAFTGKKAEKVGGVANA